MPEPCSLSILCSSFAAGVRITVSALLPRCKVTVRKSQATRSTAQSASLGQQLRYQKRATRQSNIKYAKAAQKLCAALKLVQQLQASQQQLVDRSAGCQQESARLKRILTRTARSGRHARARCAVLLQSVHESSALQTRCHDLEGMVTHLSAALTAANKKAAQDGTCLGLANSDIRALETLTQDLQQSSHQQTSQRQHLQQQLSHSEAGNRKLVNANQNLKASIAGFCMAVSEILQGVLCFLGSRGHLNWCLQICNFFSAQATGMFDSSCQHTKPFLWLCPGVAHTMIQIHEGAYISSQSYTLCHRVTMCTARHYAYPHLCQLQDQ